MSKRPRQSQIETLFERFLAAHGVADETQFGRWAREQPELREDPTILGSDGWKQLEKWLGLKQLTVPQQDPGPAHGGSLVGRIRDSSARRLGGREPITGPRNLREGDQVGGFRLTRFIAQGGMGQVWEAHDENLKRSVALKVVLPERVDEYNLELFAREARAGGRLSHPNIVTTLAHGTNEGLAWIAQELIEGSWTVKDFLDELRVDDRVPDGYYGEVAMLVARVADGLQAAHDAGVVHRDVKPRNILIAKDDTPQLTDFGLARVNDDSFFSDTGQFAGTWAYMSPEQVTAKRMGLDHRTDIFSLGVVLYELLTLRRPFEGDTTHQIAEQIIAVDPPMPSDVHSQCPREMAIIAGKAIAKAPGKRYQNIRDMAADLRRHLAHEPILASAPSPWARIVKWTLRNPAKTLGAAVAGLATIAISIVGLIAIRNAEQATQNAKLAQARAHELADTNRALEGQVEVSTARLDDILSLSALKDLSELVDRAETLWPPYPEMITRFEAWLEDAHGLVEGRALDPERGLKARPSLVEHKLKLAELHGLAIAQTDPAKLASAHAHPRYPELLDARDERQWYARMLGIELWPSEAEVAARLAEEDLPEEAGPLNSLAWAIVDPSLPRHGEEQRALLIATRAVARGEGAQRARFLDTLAWARYRVGRLDAALAAGEQADAGADDGSLEPSLERLRDTVSGWRLDALPARRAELERLDLKIESLSIAVGESVFLDPEDAWWQRQLVSLIVGLEELGDPETGLMGDTRAESFGWGVTARLVFARTIGERSSNGQEAAPRWEHVISAVAASPKYGGLVLAPQMGLLPIGEDPVSGLWEFAHLQTGEPALRGQDGKLVLSEESGLVFVLIPGGTFIMGNQKDDPDGPNFDLGAISSEGPPHEVDLSAFFLSKFEMTQAQWRRANSVNPSYYAPHKQHVKSLLHPVESVSWNDCRRVLMHLGLSLPSEAQWECGARGGTTTPWWTGRERESLRGKVNIADKTAGDAGAPWSTITAWPDFEDGCVLHTEVGSFPPNGFGLHEMAGNVWEYCLDGYDADAYEANRPRDPVVSWKNHDLRVTRGGGYMDDVSGVRSALRYFDSPTSRTGGTGVRPARVVDVPRRQER